MTISSTKKGKAMSTPEVTQTVETVEVPSPAPALTFAQIQEQIKILTQQAEAIRKAEIASVIDDIKSKITQYGITAQELGFTVFPITNKFNPTPSKPSSVAPKYQNSDGTKTWSGRGIKPKWVEEYLNAGGKIDDLLINH